MQTPTEICSGIITLMLATTSSTERSSDVFGKFDEWSARSSFVFGGSHATAFSCRAGRSLSFPGLSTKTCERPYDILEEVLGAVIGDRPKTLTLTEPQACVGTTDLSLLREVRWRTGDNSESLERRHLSLGKCFDDTSKARLAQISVTAFPTSCPLTTWMVTKAPAGPW